MITKPVEKPPECSGCGLEACGHVPMQRVPMPQYDILLVGQAPGATEVITKVPFTGSAGKMLWRLFHEVGVDKQKLNLTNVVSCAPPEDREPSRDEIALCEPRLKAEILMLKPKLIVALGEVASNTLTGRTKMQSIRGQRFPLLGRFGYECEVLCLLHPSFIMRQRQWIDIALTDARLIEQFFNPCKSTVVKRSEPLFVYDPSPSDLSEHFEKMSTMITATDIETPGQLDILSASIIGIAFCAEPDFAVGLDFTHNQGMDRWEVMKRFLEDKNAKKCTQNGGFDTGVLETNGIIAEGLEYDTLLAEHTMNSDLPGNLDFLRGRYTDVPQYKPTKMEMKSIGAWTAEKRLNMNCWDVVATLKVMLAQKKKMSKAQLEVLYNIEMPLIPICNSMTRKGVKVDVNTLALLHSHLAPQAEAIEKEHFVPKGLNPRSPKQLCAYFGISSSGEDEIEALIKRNHPESAMLQALLNYRGMQKVVSVYLQGVYARLDKNNRVHAKSKITGTGTGRLACSDPNLQNVPKDLRVIYIPDDEDHVFIEGDYNQLEVRVAAVIAPEPTMLKELAEGLYIHKVMGLEVYERDWDDLDDQEKLRVKTVVFGTFYGRGARSIAMEFGVPVRTAEHWQNICLRKYPGLLDYLERQKNIFISGAGCRTPFGRVRALQTATQAFNTPIQSSAADVMLTRLKKLYDAKFDIRMTVYDSIIIQAEKKHVVEVAEAFKEIMQSPIEQLNNYSFPVKVKAGPNWYELEEV